MKLNTRTIVVLTPFLSLIWSCPSQAESPSNTSKPAATEEAGTAQARTAVQEAEQLYQAEDWASALKKYQSAYALMVGHPARNQVLNNIGLCQEKLLRIHDAIASYESYLAGLSSLDPERALVREKIESLKANAGYLKVVVQPGSGAPLPEVTLRIDGQNMQAADEYMLPAGNHEVLMQPEGLDSQTKPVTLIRGEHQELSFELIDPYKEAKERVSRAEQLYESGNYDAALTEFQRAYDTMVGHPARSYVLYNVARCQERLYRYDAAVSSYKEYLNIAAEDEADRPKVEATIESLEGFLGTIILQISLKNGASLPKYEVWVDGHLVGEDVTRFLIPGGTHQVEIRAEGFEGATQEVQVPSRADKTASFVLSPLAKEYKGISKTYFYTAAGLTVAAAGTGAIFGVLTLGKRSAIDAKEPEAVTQDEVDALKRTALYADVFFISAGVLATSATILAFLTDWSTEQPGKTTGVRVRELAILPSHQGGFLSVGGTFSW